MASQQSTEPIRVPLDEADLRTGLALTDEAIKAQARFEAATEAERIFAAEMARKYKMAPDRYCLRDWITGFERVEQGAEDDSTD